MVGWLTIADQAVPAPTPDPVTAAEPPIDLTLNCEGDIGPGGDFDNGSGPRPDFWESGLPFISNADGKSVDWTDVGLWSLGVMFTSFFSNVAETVATLWDVLVIDRAQDISAAYTRYVEEVFFQGFISTNSFSSAAEIASDTGLIGALVIVAVGGYLLASVVGVIRDE